MYEVASHFPLDVWTSSPLMDLLTTQIALQTFETMKTTFYVFKQLDLNDGGIQTCLLFFFFNFFHVQRVWVTNL